MRAIQRSQRDALAVFSEDSGYRRAIWQEYLRKLREARQQATNQQQSAEVAVSSSMAELMTPSTPECDSIGCMGVSHA